MPFSGGRPAGEPIDFLTGFLADGEARGRPVGVLFDAPRGRLLVADDVSNTVWSVTPRNRPQAPVASQAGASPPPRAT